MGIRMCKGFEVGRSLGFLWIRQKFCGWRIVGKEERVQDGIVERVVGGVKYNFEGFFKFFGFYFKRYGKLLRVLVESGWVGEVEV